MANSSKTKKGQDSPEGKKGDNLRKAATAPKGKYSQPKGDSKHNTKPRYAKPQNPKSSYPDSMEEMEF